MIKLKVNGKNQQFNGDPETPLRWASRSISATSGRRSHRVGEQKSEGQLKSGAQATSAATSSILRWLKI